MASQPASNANVPLTPGADLIKAITTLANKDHVSVEFRPLPAEMLGGGALVKAPHVAIVRTGDRVEIQSLREHVEAARGRPFERRGMAKTLTLDAFVALVNRHKVEKESVVFAKTDWREPRLTAVIDYHAAAKDTPDNKETLEDLGTGFGRHRVVYDYPLSDAWKAWVEKNGKPMDQADFATFLEDRITDLAAPQDFERQTFERDFKAKFAVPTELIDLSRGLEVMVGARVKNRIRLESGETQMVFEVQHSDADGNELTVPGLFLLSVAPFDRGDVIRIPCRLRYRTQGGNLVWFYQMIQPDRFISERLDDDMALVAAQTGLPVFAGSPEMSA